MRVAVEISEIHHPLRTGVQRCRRGLLEGLAAALPDRHELRPFTATRFTGRPPRFLAGRADARRYFPLTARIEEAFRVRSPFPPPPDGGGRTLLRRAFNRLAFDGTSFLHARFEETKRAAYRFVARGRLLDSLDRGARFLWGADLFLWSSLYCRFAPGALNFFFVHDLTPLLLPAFHQAETARRFRAEADHLRRRPFFLLTNSESTRHEAILALRFDGARVFAVPLGAGEEFRRLEGPERGRAAAACAALGVEPGRFLLSVATFEPRKNLENVVRAFRALRDSVGGGRLSLVLAGDIEQGWENRRILAEVREAGPRIVCPGPLEDESLVDLYNTAAAFLFPSWHEGFGLPVVEAMACGCPAIVSDRGALPETAGGAGLVVDPADPGAIAAAARRVLEDGALRRDLAARGLARAARFTWRRSGERLVEIFETVQGRLTQRMPAR